MNKHPPIVLQQPTLWQTCWWWLTPRGRLQLRLTQALLTAQGAAARGDWPQMLQATQRASNLQAGHEEVGCWHGRALLLNGRAGEAAAALQHSPQPTSWQRQWLLLLATLTSQPTLEHVEPCLALLEQKWTMIDPTEKELALDALAAALRPSSKSNAQQITAIADFSARLMAITGPLPWVEYNLALKDLFVEQAFAQAAHRCRTGLVAPPGTWPVDLIQAACFSLLEQWNDLAQLFRSAQVPLDEFGADRQFFSLLLDMFVLFAQSGSPADLVAFAQRLDSSGGNFVQAVPALRALTCLLNELLSTLVGTPAQQRLRHAIPVAELPDHAWAQWLYLRLQLIRGTATEISQQLSMDTSPSLHAALRWEQLVWRQEFAALLPSPIVQRLHEELTDFTLSVETWHEPLWQQNLALRIDLTALQNGAQGKEAVQPNHTDVGCPWLPVNNPVYQLLGREAQIDCAYLRGRQALRMRAVDQALTWFQHAQVLTADQATSRLTQARFAPVLAYWQGVALAHQNRLTEACQSLQSCLHGAKAHEAYAQLGLIAVAQGDLAAASAYLNQCPPPQPPAAAYLAGLIAQRRGDLSVADTTLEALLSRSDWGANVYWAAALRLRGAMAEAANQVSLAAANYHAALDQWSFDVGAAERLTRLWVKAGYQQVCNQPNDAHLIPMEKLPTAIQHSSRAELWLALVHCLAAATRHTPPAEPMRLSPTALHSSAGPALALLATRILLGKAQPARAQEILACALAAHPAHSEMCGVTALLQRYGAIKELYRSGGVGAARPQVEELVARLKEAQAQSPGDRRATFWCAVAQLGLNPELAAGGEFLRTILSDQHQLYPHRLFAATIGLFAQTSEEQRTAALLCCHLLGEGAEVDEATKTLWRCLAAYRQGDEAAFLQHYALLERAWPLLPCDDEELYVAASQARLRNGEIESVTHGFLPASLIGLNHAPVRHVIGLAFARSAAQKAETNGRAALNDLEQAITLLALLDKGVSEHDCDTERI